MIQSLPNKGIRTEFIINKVVIGGTLPIKSTVEYREKTVE